MGIIGRYQVQLIWERGEEEKIWCWTSNVLLACNVGLQFILLKSFVDFSPNAPRLNHVSTEFLCDEEPKLSSEVVLK